MCGIAGIIGAPTESNQAALRRMTDAMRQRGPDGEGYWTSPLHPIGHCAMFGHRRLSILDLSKAGHQPMSSQSRRTWITHNGAIYNYRELREELAAAGDYRFTTGTDTVTRSSTAVNKNVWVPPPEHPVTPIRPPSTSSKDCTKSMARMLLHVCKVIACWCA